MTGFFFNPNIHPFSEFEKRKETLKNYSKIALFSLILDESYDLKGFLKGAIESKDRCLFCYETRLRRLFEKARELKIEYATTTLLYSKFQRHEEIKGLAQEISKDYGIIFLYRDFREGWKEGVEESKRIGMYRQNYCGCIFSEFERLRRK